MKSMLSQYDIWKKNQDARAEGRRYCSRCDTVKDVADFNPSDAQRSGAYCRTCKQKHNRDRYLAKGQFEVPDKHRAVAYGMSPEEYQTRMAGQDRKCACCRTPLDDLPSRQRHVEHDHATGAVRGITCMRCNILIGAARDEPERIQGILDYLKK